MSDQQKINKLLERLESLVERLEKLGVQGASEAPSSEATTKYDEFVNEHVQPFLNLTKKIGGDLNQLAELVEQAIKNQRDIIQQASQTKNPNNTDKLIAFYKPLTTTLNELGKYASAKRTNHLMGANEAFKSFTWVAVPNTPVTHVKECIPSAEFYTNKVLMQYRNTGESGKDHVEWVKALKNLVTKLADYVKEYHMTGLRWNPQGKDL